MKNLQAASDVMGMQIGKEANHIWKDTARGTLEANRTTSPTAEAAAVPLSRSEAAGQSQGVNRHPVRAPDGYSLGRPATGIGVRKRHDVLATAARLASGWGMAAFARVAVVGTSGQ
jgi:hypothetical protein